MIERIMIQLFGFNFPRKNMPHSVRASNQVVLHLSLLTTILFSSCGHERGGCDGSIIVEYQIPDLIMHLGDRAVRKDLIYEEPIVFRHTKGSIMSITPTTNDGITVIVNVEKNVEMNRLSILTVKPRFSGEAIVHVEAKDDCFDRSVTTSFRVTVLDTIQNKQ